MYSFSGNQILARELNMKSSRIDMHSHVLPSFDDGSRSDEETLSILKDMKANGTDCVVWTPHYNHPKLPDINYGGIISEFEKKALFFQESADIEIITGSELYLLPPFAEKNGYDRRYEVFTR